MRNRIVLLAIAAAVACSSAPNGGAAGATDRNVITSEEIASAGSQDAYSVIQSLRPNWLTMRGMGSINIRETIKVYLDGNLFGGVESLRLITAGSIGSVRRLDGLEATQRYGLDHGQGAILIQTLKE